MKLLFVTCWWSVLVCITLSVLPLTQSMKINAVLCASQPYAMYKSSANFILRCIDTEYKLHARLKRPLAMYIALEHQIPAVLLDASATLEDVKNYQLHAISTLIIVKNYLRMALFSDRHFLNFVKPDLMDAAILSISSFKLEYFYHDVSQLVAISPLRNQVRAYLARQCTLLKRATDPSTGALCKRSLATFGRQTSLFIFFENIFKSEDTDMLPVTPSLLRSLCLCNLERYDPINVHAIDGCCEVYEFFKELYEPLVHVFLLYFDVFELIFFLMNDQYEDGISREVLSAAPHLQACFLYLFFKSCQKFHEEAARSTNYTNNDVAASASNFSFVFESPEKTVKSFLQEIVSRCIPSEECTEKVLEQYTTILWHLDFNDYLSTMMYVIVRRNSPELYFLIPVLFEKFIHHYYSIMQHVIFHKYSELSTFFFVAHQNDAFGLYLACVQKLCNLSPSSPNPPSSVLEKAELFIFGKDFPTPEQHAFLLREVLLLYAASYLPSK